MNKFIASILALLGLGAGGVSYEHLDFRPEISTQMSQVLLDGEITPPTPPNDNEDCPCNKNTGIITHGDGHKSKCPCDNGECGCANKSQPAPPTDDTECLPGAT
ncbi:MAG: hypothetical protein ACYS5F_14555 [Planctomycetota bacterium]|jgi:hypothetical protein